MKPKPTTKRVFVTLLVTIAVTAVGCTKDEEKGAVAVPEGAEKIDSEEQVDSEEKIDSEKLVEQIGAEPGPVEREEGPSAVLASVEGEVEVRRLGTEEFSAAKAEDSLYPGDQVRAGEGARATLIFADESTVELAELSSIAIGNRVATADPASSAAMLSGVARFGIAPRVPGEGPFMVFTPAGLVATKGTVFGVGVAAQGDARVGVESGEVDVAGSASLDAPVTLEANHAVDLTAAGGLDAAAEWSADDWGDWRDQAEADVDIAATADLHADAMASLEAELASAYAELETLGTELSKFEAEAAAQASAENEAGYSASLPEASVAIEASFLSAMRLQWLTHAYLSHAVLATDLYVRHPEVVAWTKVEPRVQASVLWPKRFDATAYTYFEPLRVQYYLHHPRGRAHAALVGVAVPEFYAKVEPPEVPAAQVRAKLKFKAFTPPRVKVTAAARPVWIGAPSADFHVKTKVEAPPPRGKVAFWVRPKKPRSKAVLGVKAKAKIKPAFAMRPPRARGKLKAQAGLALGHKIKVDPPNLDAAAQARANWKGEVNAPELAADGAGKVEAPKADVKGKLAAKGKAGAKAKAKVKAPKPKAKAKLKGSKKASARGRAQAGGNARAGARAKVKTPKVKAPKVEAKGSAKLSLGK